MKKKLCKHIGETPFMTAEKRHCPVCGKIYYYAAAPIDFKMIARNGQKGSKK